jgi:signal transduction histidine kinase/ActR/RegA family two-component response regulator
MFQANAESIPFGITVLISAGLAFLAWRRRRGRGLAETAPAFAVMMAGEAAWALFEALELVIIDDGLKRLCFALRVAAASITLLGMLAFVLRYTECTWWLAPRRFAVLAVPMLVLTLLAWTNPWHHFYWEAIRNERLGEFWIAMPDYGPGFRTHMTYSYGLAAVATILLGRAVYRSSGVFRVQAWILLLGVLLPWVVNIIDMSQVFGYIHVDSVALAFGLMGLAFLPGLFRYRLLDLTPVAWASVVRGMDDAVVVIDRRGRIVELNSAAGRLMGRERREVLGSEAARAFDPWPALARRLDRIADQVEMSFELLGPDADGCSVFDARISRLGGDPGSGDDAGAVGDAQVRASGWVLVLRDISASKRAEGERVRVLREQAAREEAEAANRSKDRLLATLSHELRTPLTHILATVSAILERPETPEPIRAAMEMIRRNVNLEVRLIDDLLDLTRVRGGKLHLKRELVDAHELIYRVAEICRADLRAAGLQLVLDLAARRHDVDADPIRLQQVLWNLLKNAIKFTPTGGTLTVRSRDGQHGVNASASASTGLRAAGMLVITVSDTGIGIDAEVLPRIFDMFEQGGAEAMRRSGGLGLGLTISRSIVEQHGGRLIASSEGFNRGACFTIEMPAASTAETVPTIEPVSADERAARRPQRILLVDDNDDTRNSLAELLGRRGHDVRVAEGVEAALRIATGCQIDLLISDIELVDGTGLQLIGALRSERPIPAIALSGFGSSDDLEFSRSAGFAVHLMKPVDLQALEAAIERVAMPLPAAGVAPASCP